MNKQIESIAIETLNHLRHNVLSRSDMEDIQVPDVFIEKFAQLIVRECAELTRWKDFDMSVEQRIRLSVYHDIKEHFGVE